MSEALKAASKHPDIEAALLRVSQSREGVRAEEGAWFPQIGIFAEYDPQRTYTMPMNGKTSVIDDDGWSAGATLRQRVYDFSRTSYRVDAARIKERIAALSADDAKALMRYQVRNSYAQIVVRQEAIKARRSDLEAKKAMYKEALALVKQGLKTRADALRFKSAMDLARSDLAMAGAALSSAVASLEQLTGRRIAADTSFETRFLYKGVFPAGKAAVEKLLKKNISIRVARKNAQSTHASYKATVAERYGSIDIVGDITHLDTLTGYDSKTLGIRYSAPIYQGGALSARSEQARVQEMIDARKVESLKRKIIEEYRGLYADWQALGSSIKAQKARISSAKEALNLIEARYKEGLSTYIDVLDAQATLLDARLGLLNAYFQRRNRLDRVEYLYGN